MKKLLSILFTVFALLPNAMFAYGGKGSFAPFSQKHYDAHQAFVREATLAIAKEPDALKKNAMQKELEEISALSRGSTKEAKMRRAFRTTHKL